MNTYIAENLEQITEDLLKTKDNSNILKTNHVSESTKSKKQSCQQWTKIEKRLERILTLLITLIILATLSATTDFLRNNLGGKVLLGK